MERPSKDKQLPVLFFFLINLLAGFLFLPETPQASSAPASTIKKSSLTRQPEFEISLVTFAPTDSLFEWFGHTALVVENLHDRQSSAYGFGGFSFSMDDFLMFSMGKFVFWSTKTDTPSLLSRHRKKGRHIVVQKLDLSPQQIVTIRQQLQYWMKPQNRFYIYDHFKDNCATRLRDIVNEALDGAIARQSMANTGRTIRDYIHRMTAHQILFNFLLHFVLSDGVDQPVSHWETMFLPDRLMMVFQNTTNPETGLPLVSKRRDQVPREKSRFYLEKVTVPDTAGREWITGLCMGLFLAILARLYLKRSFPGHYTPVVHSNKELPAKKILDLCFVKSYPLLISVFGAIFGLLGVILFFMAVIGDHQDVFWNENFFLLNPLTITLLPLGLLKILGKAGRYFACVSLVCGTIGVVGIVLKILPIFDQANGQQIRVLLPVLIVIGLTGFIELKRSLKSNSSRR